MTNTKETKVTFFFFYHGSVVHCVVLPVVAWYKYYGRPHFTL